MTLNPVYASYGLDLATSVTGFFNDGIDASLANTLQRYKNEMLEISAAMNNDRITINEIETRDASVRLSFALQQTASQDAAKAEVAAAAAGVKGSNVDSTMRGLRRSAQFAQAARKHRTSMEQRSHLEERRSVALGVAMSKDVTVHSKPSLLSAAIGLGTKLIDTYDNSLPEDDKLGNQMKTWWSP